MEVNLQATDVCFQAALVFAEYMRMFNQHTVKWYKMHLSRQQNCWSLRCSWRITCRCCTNYIFIFNLTLGFNALGKDKCKIRQGIFKFWDLVWLILEVWWYVWCRDDILQEWNGNQSLWKSYYPHLNFHLLQGRNQICLLSHQNNLIRVSEY